MTNTELIPVTIEEPLKRLSSIQEKTSFESFHFPPIKPSQETLASQRVRANTSFLPQDSSSFFNDSNLTFEESLPLITAFPPMDFLIEPSTDSSLTHDELLNPVLNSTLEISSIHSLDSEKFIKSCSVPCYSKLGSKWYYGVRVEPEAEETIDSKEELKREMKRLGRMEMAGVSCENPYTVFRSWSEFLEFSTRLSAAFPFIPNDSDQSSSSSRPPSSFYRQPPRLSKKLVLFVTRSTLLARQEELDLFVRRLFDMPTIVKKSSIVLDFFKMRDGDTLTSTRISSPITSISDESNSRNLFSEALANVDSPNATIRARKDGRRSLGLKKSIPDLRKLMMSPESVEGGLSDDAFDGPLYVPRLRPSLVERSTDLGLERSEEATTFSGLLTPTSDSSPSPLTPTNEKLYQPSINPPPIRSSSMRLVPSEVVVKSSAPSIRKRSPFAPLRHFRSLQDLRQTFSASPSQLSTSAIIASQDPESTPPSPGINPSVPSSPPPSSSSSPSSPPPTLSRSRKFSSLSLRMAKSSTHFNNSNSLLPSSGSRFGFSSSNNHLGTRQNSHTKSASDSSSFEAREAWPETIVLMDRKGSRSERGRNPEVVKSRRPSTTNSKKSTTRKSVSPTATSPKQLSRSNSASSGSDSVMSSSNSSSNGNSNKWERNHSRNSTDYSDFEMEKEVPGVFGIQDSVNQFYLDSDGTVTKNNMVPLPPFFPLPPSMTSPGYGQQFALQQQRTPTRQSSHDNLRSRSRLNSISSPRPLPSHSSLPPALVQNLPSSSSPSLSPPIKLASVKPQDRSTITFKILHSTTNLILRIQREGISLKDLKHQIVKKFEMITPNPLSSLTATNSEFEEQDSDWNSWKLIHVNPNIVALSENGEVQVDKLSDIIIDSEEKFEGLLRKTVYCEKVTLKMFLGT